MLGKLPVQLALCDAAVNPFNVPIEPADKVFIHEASVFSNNGDTYHSHLQLGGCMHKEVRDS